MLWRALHAQVNGNMLPEQERRWSFLQGSTAQSWAGVGYRRQAGERTARQLLAPWFHGEKQLEALSDPE